jgi:hypothetical protein
LLILLLPLAAQAQNRVALLIGNQGYAPEVGRLANPHNDIALLEEALKGIGFDVATVRDASLSAFHQAVNAHIRRVRAAGAEAISFLYYSGHGAQDGATGINYVIPIDVGSAEDSALWDRSLRLNEITYRLKAEAGNASHFVVIDACRNALKLTRTGSRALMQSKGFVPLREESGMLIAYATAEGELASDIGAGSGPYARVLAEEIVKPGVEAVTMFRRVQLRVRAAIGQEPWLGFGALGEVHLAGVGPSRLALPPPPSLEQQAELAFWSVVRESNDRTVVQTYLDRYPQGAFADVARALIAKLRREEEQRALAAREQERKQQEEARLAALAAAPKVDRAEIARSLQFELKRVGCFTGSVDGLFDKKTRDALEQFAKLAAIEAKGKEPTLEVVRLVRSFDKRVCPLKCGANERAEQDQCVRVVCASGQAFKDGACVDTSAAAQKEAAGPTSKAPGKNCFTFEGRRFCQ